MPAKPGKTKPVLKVVEGGNKAPEQSVSVSAPEPEPVARLSPADTIQMREMSKAVQQIIDLFNSKKSEIEVLGNAVNLATSQLKLSMFHLLVNTYGLDQSKVYGWDEHGQIFEQEGQSAPSSV